MRSRLSGGQPGFLQPSPGNQAICFGIQAPKPGQMASGPLVVIGCRACGRVTDLASKKRKFKTMKLAWVGLLFPLCACSFLPPITGGSEKGGTANYVATRYGEDAAMETARDHCARYDRSARKLHYDVAANTVTFTCEEPGMPMQEGSRPL